MRAAKGKRGTLELGRMTVGRAVLRGEVRERERKTGGKGRRGSRESEGKGVLVNCRMKREGERGGRERVGGSRDRKENQGKGVLDKHGLDGVGPADVGAGVDVPPRFGGHAVRHLQAPASGAYV